MGDDCQVVNHFAPRAELVHRSGDGAAVGRALERGSPLHGHGAAVIDVCRRYDALIIAATCGDDGAVFYGSCVSIGAATPADLEGGTVLVVNDGGAFDVRDIADVRGVIKGVYVAIGERRAIAAMDAVGRRLATGFDALNVIDGDCTKAAVNVEFDGVEALEVMHIEVDGTVDANVRFLAGSRGVAAVVRSIPLDHGGVPVFAGDLERSFALVIHIKTAGDGDTRLDNDLLPGKRYGELCANLLVCVEGSNAINNLGVGGEHRSCEGKRRSDKDTACTNFHKTVRVQGLWVIEKQKGVTKSNL